MTSQASAVHVSGYMDSAVSSAWTSGTTSTRLPLLPPPDADCFDRGAGVPMPLVRKAPLLHICDRGYVLARPLPVSVEWRGGFCEIEHRELGLFGRGATCAEAVADFVDYLIADYRAYAEQPDDKLDEHALALAERYRTLVRRR